jgi:hypothetical protein
MITIMTAIQSLRPNAGCVVRDNAEIEWLDDVQTEPTQAEIDAEVIRLQAVYDSQAYARNRKAAYAPLAEQLDMKYHDLQNGTETWLDHIKEVKAKYPKGDK